jgi:Protein of unknown function (DUF2948)
MKDPLKLIALDRDDLDVVSTHLQDAVLKVCDVIWHPAEQRVVLALSRFDWGCTCDGSPDLRRCRTALRFERVSCFKARNVRPTDKGAVLNLLAVEFAENDPPGGVVTLTFSGGAAMRAGGPRSGLERADAPRAPRRSGAAARGPALVLTKPGMEAPGRVDVPTPARH